MKLNANKSKFLINSFANGHLDRVIQLHAQYGNEIFDFKWTPRRSYTNQKAIFYSLKNGHLNIIDFYIKSVGDEANFSESEVRQSLNSSCHSIERLSKWINDYNESSVRHIIDFEKFKSMVISHLINHQTVKYDVIDFFIERYPETLSKFIELCGSSKKGIQLKRELLLKNILNER